ncbi:MAG: ATP-binding protein [Pseudomonadota bacterium]
MPSNNNGGWLNLPRKLEKVSTEAASALVRWGFPDSAHHEDSLEFWRIRIMFTIWFSGVLIGLFALFPSMSLALREGRWDVALLDLGFYLWLFILFFARGTRTSLRAAGTLGAVYILGFSLILTLGPLGAGYVWIFAFAVFTGLLLGMRAAVIAWVLNLAAVVVTAWLIRTNSLPWASQLESPFERWLVIGASFLLLNALASLSTALMLRGLKLALEQKQKISENLEGQRAELAATNKRLLEEIAVRTQAEAALRKSEELSRKLIEHSAVPVAVFGGDGTPQFVNLAFTAAFGWTIADFPTLGKWEEKLFPDPDYRVEAIREFRKKGFPGNPLGDARDKKIACRDGGIREAAFHSNFLPDGRYLTQLIDVTERNQGERDRNKLENQLRQAQKMEAIGALAGGIAHDFNNLLSVILGFSAFALMDMNVDDPLFHSIKEIENAGARGATLVRQLLAFSRKQIVHFQVLDLNESVRDIKKMLVRLIGEDIEFSLKPAPDLWKVEADPGQIDQVIMNLSANARDAMPTGGLLAIKTANVHLDADYFHDHALEGEPGPYVLLSISDTGQGMDKETLSRIFEPFFTTKDRNKGAGLGLSTVYGIVKQTGGFIWAYSEPGLGATFRIYLPKADKGEVITAAQSPRAGGAGGAETIPGGAETILVVEDDDMVRNLAARVLAHKGYRILQAADGDEAVDVMKNHPDPIHLVLTDVIMPKTSGREVSEKVAELRPGAKVIFMSGYIDDTVFRHGVIEKGANFIEKPLSPETLAQKVRAVLDENRG